MSSPRSVVREVPELEILGAASLEEPQNGLQILFCRQILRIPVPEQEPGTAVSEPNSFISNGPNSGYRLGPEQINMDFGTTYATGPGASYFLWANLVRKSPWDSRK